MHSQTFLREIFSTKKRSEMHFRDIERYDDEEKYPVPLAF